MYNQSWKIKIKEEAGENPAKKIGKMVGIRRMKLGSQGLEVSAQGLGCMGMSARPRPPPATGVPIEVGKLKIHPNNCSALRVVFMTRDAEEEIIPTCRELGIGIVAYSTLGRGFFSSGPKLIENMSEGDFRKNLPRFRPENFEHNKLKYDSIHKIALKKGCTPSQLARSGVGSPPRK
ncbi:hypothetical protein IFM89_029191 [Coptis chinensis]|uniref:NADP-dependent oxidoreductase domain-containing protein n=1 Tax=Coptis chinensis TaxID=261450 RepID=A0A835MFL2_9MAGN|nr:hypothetical protein IFM89_029191 [Coptis chinensis]